jgi:thiosulfate/3-mercaptopyruvate sulfurtransferase
MIFQLVALLMLSPLAAPDAQKERYPRSDLLVEAADLTKEDMAKGYRVLDARSKNEYQAGHIPGAVWVDHATWAKAFAEAQDAAAWAKRIGELGIAKDAKVVIYDDNKAKDAARIWWILRYWDLDARLLNGGWGAWKTAGGKVSTAPPHVDTVPVKLTPQTKRLAVKNDVLEALKGKSAQIIDARSEDEYCGTMKLAKRGGAIPESIHREWSDVLDPKTGRFKSAADLDTLFRESGIQKDRPAVTYCQSGGRAAVMAFALELMGVKAVRNYYRSWSEWGNALDTPVVKPKAKD